MVICTKHMVRWSTLLLIYFLLSISCEDELENDCIIDEESYPTTLYTLTEGQLQELHEEFDLLNNDKICSRLNKYGLTGHDHCFRNNPKIKISDEDIAQRYAVNTLVKNKKFTNVTSSKKLENCGFNIAYISDDSTHWGVRFGSQKYQGIEVFNTSIEISMFGDGVFNIDGFWYKDIYIPSINRTSKNSAKKKVVGQKIIWHGISGEPHEFTVSTNSIGDNIKKIIFPLENEETVELRITWKIPIEFSSFIGWHIYLDTTTGGIIAIIQEFRT